MAIVNDYFARHHCESTGTYADAIVYCREVQKAVDALGDVLRGSPGLNAAAAAQSVADREIEAWINTRRPFDLCRFKDELGWLADVCENICRDFATPQPNRFQPGDQWRLMARRLIDWARKRGLKVTVSRDLDVRQKLSPFTGFVKRLQAVFPNEYQKKFNSDDALSKELSAQNRASKTGLKS